MPTYQLFTGGTKKSKSEPVRHYKGFQIVMAIMPNKKLGWVYMTPGGVYKYSQSLIVLKKQIDKLLKSKKLARNPHDLRGSPDVDIHEKHNPRGKKK